MPIAQSSWFFLVASMAVAMILAISPAEAEQPEQAKAHHTRSGFRNIQPDNHPGYTGLIKWQWERLWSNDPNPGTPSFPRAENDPAFLKANGTRTTLTWIGHATLLLQLDGKNILTDPQFSERASPVRWAGPKRVVPPGLSMADLPRIHAVILSHDHYDSLDRPTVRMLVEREGGNETAFFVPLGLKAWFLKMGVTNVHELDWWDRERFRGLEIIAVPVHHWSKRLSTSRNETLWAGWIVRTDRFSFFFAGDSGYTPVFGEIGSKFGPFDLSAIPIGAYEPRWFMRHHHINPEEAVKVHLDVRSKKSVGMHWGTFVLSDEPLDEPPKKLAEARKSLNVPEKDFVTLQHGEMIILPDNDQSRRAGE